MKRTPPSVPRVRFPTKPKTAPKVAPKAAPEEQSEHEVHREVRLEEVRSEPVAAERARLKR